MKRSVPALLLIAFVVVGCGGLEASGNAVFMTDHHSFPDALGVESGETVVWINDSEETHTVTAVEASLPDGAEYFSSGGASSEDEAIDDLPSQLIQPGEEFEWTFEEPGIYRYYCIPHRSDGMEGSVEVQ